LLKLNPPFDVLTNEWVIGALAVLLTIEVIVDKIPAADTVNDIIQTFIRPTAGAVLFAANTNAITDLHPVFAAILGLVLAFGVHAAKSAARPVVTASTGGLGNAFVSVGEDVVATGVSIAALLAPILVGIMLLLAAIAMLWWVFGRNRERESSTD
jgi:hypothetical protein